jgi:hypothetical protein
MNTETCAPKIKAIIYVRKGKARNNFIKHATEGNVAAIDKQIKRGSVKVIK